MQLRRTLLAIIIGACLMQAAPGLAQGGGVIRGIVRLKTNGVALHNATIRITQIGRTVSSAEDGAYEFIEVPAGTYTVIASMPSMVGEPQSVTLMDGAVAQVNLMLELAPVHTQVTVSSSGREQLTMEAFQTVTSLDALDLAKTPATSLGESLNNQPGVAKRSSGPGSSRPVIRGFDGDRVLVMQDGAPAGGLGFQSGDHAEPINTATLERIEILKGPSTLLYGSNAVGGVVNALTAEAAYEKQPVEGLHGFVTGFGGSNNDHAGGSASFNYGKMGWRIFGDGGAQRAGNYSAGGVEIQNSQTRMENAQIGFGRTTAGSFFSASGGYDDGLYGIVGEDSNIEFRRYSARFSGGLNRTGGFWESFRSTVAYTDWQHAEIEDGAAATTLLNKQMSYRGVFEQKRAGALTGRFGVSGVIRGYQAIGEETLTPPTTQQSIAGFALEELAAGRAKFQLGGRFDHIGYSPEGGVSRGFNGVSAGAGVHVLLWTSGAFVANYTSSFRAPALEELYNQGPHPGNIAFEIGDVALDRERSNGIDLALRHEGSRIHTEAAFFYYDIHNFVYLAPTPDFDEDLRIFNYAQAGARFVGAETQFDVAVHPRLWINLGFDSVNAELKASNTPLPRIPPIRGRAGLDIRYEGLSIQPEVQVANAQRNTFTFETPTAGYTVLNLKGSYTAVRPHGIYVLSARFFNVGDRVYRNHLSFVKDQGPEIGRGLNVSFTVRYF